MTDAAIRFSAQVVKVQTTADYGIRVTLEMEEGNTDTAKLLMDIRRNGGMLEIAAVPVDKHGKRNKSRKNETQPDTSATY